MKIFITGGTGFIGQPLVKKLREKGHNLCLLSSNLAESEKWKKEIEDFGPDALIHLAWEGLPDYGVEISKKNIKYALDLFSFLREINCQTVFSVGSAWEKTNPEDIFPISKKMVNLWGKAIIENFIWARIFFVYGPGQRKTSLISYLIDCWKKGEKPEIKNPSAKNDFIYIDDVTEAIAFLLENCKESGEYDIGWGKLISNQEVINIVAQKLDKKDWHKEVNSSEDSVSFSPVADIRKFKAMGWSPKITLEEGIKKTIDYLKTIKT